MQLTAPQIQSLYGISVEMQHLWDQRGLLRCERGVKRGTGKTKLYDLVGTYGLLLIDHLRKGDPIKGMPPISYTTIKQLTECVNRLTEEQLMKAARSQKWIIFGPPDCPPQIVDIEAWDGDRLFAHFWIGRPVAADWNRMVRGLSHQPETAGAA